MWSYLYFLSGTLNRYSFSVMLNSFNVFWDISICLVYGILSIILASFIFPKRSVNFVVYVNAILFISFYDYFEVLLYLLALRLESLEEFIGIGMNLIF